MAKLVKRDANIIDVTPHHTPLLARVIHRRVLPARVAKVPECTECSCSYASSKELVDAAIFAVKLVALMLIGITALGAIADRPPRTAAPQAGCK